MTLLGEGFSMGTAAPAEPSTMNMSLDDMIASRRKQAAKTHKKTASVAKGVSNTTRTIAAGRAKRNAAMNARRGLAQSAKPTAMQVEKEVQKQTTKTAAAKAKKQAKKKQSGAKVQVKVSSAVKQTSRQKRRETARAVAVAKKEQGKSHVHAGMMRPPSKKVVKAAVNAMEDKGFSIPDGMQMVISFLPQDEASKQGKKQQPGASQQKKKGNNDQANGGRRGRRGGSGGKK